MTRRTKIVLGVAAAAVVVIAIGCWVGFGRSTVNQQKLVGSWKLVSGGGGGTTLTFSADGKVKETTKWGKETYDSEGTYTVKGDAIEMLTTDDFDWDGEWGDWDGKAASGKGDKPAKSAKPNPSNQPKPPKEPKPRSMAIRSLTDTELVVSDERGMKTAYAKK